MATETTGSTWRFLLSLVCCITLLSTCSPQPASPDDPIKVGSFYRFVDENANDPRSQGRRARAGVEYRKVLRRGFWRVRPPYVREDGTIQLGDLVKLDSLDPAASEIVVLAREGGVLQYSHIELPRDAAAETVSSRPVQISTRRLSPEELQTAPVYARQLFSEPYVSRWIVAPENARLEFGIAIDSTLKNITREDVRFEVTLEFDDGRAAETLFSDVLAPGKSAVGSTNAWTDHSVRLNSYAGKKVRFVFRTTIESDAEVSLRDRIRTVPLWGDPVLLAGHAKRGVDTPNLIIISLDTLRAGHLGAYGYDKGTTPNIDRFAENAILFEQCISPTSWTKPAHASLLSGLHPTVHGAGGGYRELLLREDVVTLAELARRKGYLTVAYTDGAALSGNSGFAQGFDRYWDSGPWTWRRQGSVQVGVNRAMRWLNTRKDHPFFMFFHTYEIHGPYNPPQPFADRFKIGKKDIATMRSNSLEKSLENMALYDGGIAYTDRVIGDFLQWLEGQGILENTAIMLLSDHGEEFWDHGGVGHATGLHEELVHVPFILRLPGARPPHGRIDRMIGLSDGFATALDLLDISYDAPVDSMSLLPLIEGGRAASAYQRRSVVGAVFSYRLNGLTVSYRTAESKYIAFASSKIEGSPIKELSLGRGQGRNLEMGQALLDALSSGERPPGVTEKFYDLRVDPTERTDLSQLETSRMAESRQTLRALFEKFAKEEKEHNFSREPQLGLSPEERAELEAMGYL